MIKALGTDAGRRASLIVMAAGAVTPAWADRQIQPSVTVGTVYVDNLDLVPPGVPKTGDWIAELIPRLQLQEQAPNLSAVLDYSAQALWFRDHSALDAVHQDGAGNVSWAAMPSLLFVEARAAYTQQAIDLTQPSNAGNLFGVGNVANEFDAMVAPYLKRDFGTMTGLLRYQESLSDFSGAGGSADASLLENSRTDAVTADLAADVKDAPFFWRIDGRSARTTFDTAEPFRTDRVMVAVSEGALPSLRLTQSAGAETNVLTHSASGGLDAGFWSAGFKWVPSTRTVLEASAGHRFFGPAYSVLWTYQSRLLKYHVIYSEVATDASESTALTDFVPGQLQADPRAYNDVLRSIDTYDPYVAKQLDAGLDLTLPHTQLALHVYDLRRQYVNFTPLGNSDSTRGGEIIAKRELGWRDRLQLSAMVDTANEVSGYRYRDYRYQAEYTRDLAKTLQLSLVAVRFQRAGSSQYSSDIGELMLRKSF
jgi:hypothetical protein